MISNRFVVKRPLVNTLILLFAFTVPAFAGPTPEKDAQNAVKSWLALVDSAQYGESWENASELFRSHVGKSQWEQAVTGVRGPLGKVLERKLKSSKLATSLPGAPDGEYVVSRFNTSFENKKSGVETITVMLEKDGQWRVCGYFIL
jgi:hypothetical protein